MGNWIKLRLAEDEQQEWQQAAKAVGLGLSEYVRQAVRAQTGGRTQPEIPAEARAVKKETKVEKKSSALKKIPGLKTAAEIPEPRRSNEVHSDTVRGDSANTKPEVVTELQQHTDSPIAIRGTPLRQKNAQAMQALLGIQVVEVPEVLPPEPRPEARPKPEQPVPEHHAVTKTPPAHRAALETVPIGNPRAEAAAKEKRRNVEAFNNSRRRL